MKLLYLITPLTIFFILCNNQIVLLFGQDDLKQCYFYKFINYNIDSINYFTELSYENNSYNYDIFHINQNLLISAEVILKSVSGKSLTNTNISITSENIKEFEPLQENIKTAIRVLEKLGFEVFHNGLTITIVGDKPLYEKIFKSQLYIDVNREGTMTVSTLKELSIPDSLLNIVEKIVFIPPPTFFYKN